MVCVTYRKEGKEVCPSHPIRNSVIKESLLEGLRNVITYVREHVGKFVEMITKTKVEADKSILDSKRELEQSLTHIHKLDDIIQRLYEDNVEGKISDNRFMKTSENYEAEQKTLEHHVAELRHTISVEQENMVNVERFLTLVRKYTDIQELNAEIIRGLVERIEVY